MKKSKEFFKKAYTVSRFLFLYLFASGVVSVIIYGACGIFIPLLSGFSMNSLLSGEMLYQEAVNSGELTAAESGYFIIAAIFISIAELIPYLLTFIFSKKSFGWMKAGFIIYSVDTFVALMLLMANISAGTAPALFYVPFILLHFIGLGAAGFALYAGSQFFPKKIYGYGGPYGYYGNRAFATIRTLCLIYDRNTYQNISFTYHINGSQQGTLCAGQTRIIMLDGNYQRLVISAEGALSKETVLPASTDNVSYTVGVVLNDKGEQVVTVLPLVF